MKLQLASDLHLEFLQQRWPGERLIAPAPGADLLVLAGDIADGARVCRLAGSGAVPGRQSRVLRSFAGPDASADPAGRRADLSALMPGVALWLHGHVHDSFDYRVGGCRVIANPRGYAVNHGSAATPAELQFENQRFGNTLTLEVGA